MVGAVRFELTTSCTRNKRATRLRYAPTQEDKKCRVRRGFASLPFVTFQPACFRLGFLLRAGQSKTQFFQPQPLHQPRVELAGVQSAGSRRGSGHEKSAARTFEVFLYRQLESLRIL